ncbi:ketosynthase [Lysobacter sp. D1-1-M9]|uniref:ketosynthase n=1 Tax=Novilysobacter longmucuonensis TaxID=3098603 RepID=UPI002FCB329C
MSSTALRLVLAIAYPLLAHWASHGGGDHAAALALLDLVLLVLADGLLQRRVWAWSLLFASVLGLWRLAGTPALQLLLLAPPMLFTGLLAWLFARSLASPRGALITRIVAAMEQCEPAQLAPELHRYSRRLTAAWAWLLAGLTVANGTLALIAVPDGVLARLGHAPMITVPQEQWSWFANILNYGIVGGFFVGEYALRRRWFPVRPYRNFIDFLRRMAALGPRFWRELFEA